VGVTSMLFDLLLKYEPSIVLTSKYRLQAGHQPLMTELKHDAYHMIHSVCLTT
jgi:hypothetical protein